MIALACATGIPAREWEREAERDERALVTAVDILRQLNARLTPRHDQPAGG